MNLPLSPFSLCTFSLLLLVAVPFNTEPQPSFEILVRTCQFPEIIKLVFSVVANKHLVSVILLKLFRLFHADNPKMLGELLWSYAVTADTDSKAAAHEVVYLIFTASGQDNDALIRAFYGVNLADLVAFLKRLGHSYSCSFC